MSFIQMSTIIDVLELFEAFNDKVNYASTLAEEESNSNDKIEFNSTNTAESYLDQAINESYLYTEYDYSF